MCLNAKPILIIKWDVTLVKHELPQTGTPSRTALAAAAHRAAHQVLEHGCIFSDPLALSILGKDADRARALTEHPSRRGMRIFIVTRSRFAEDSLAAAVKDGVRQLVILGAGLDTFAYRNPFGDCLRVFEVDCLSTQVWKRRLLVQAAIKSPDSLAFVPIDFEREPLIDKLMAVGFDTEQQTFFSWLGVVPYLTEQVVWSTLSLIAGLPNRAHVVLDYNNPPDSLSPKMRVAHDDRAARVAKLGEAFKVYFETAKLHARLRTLGFVEIQDLGPTQIFACYSSNFTRSIPESGGHILHAKTVSKSK